MIGCCAALPLVGCPHSIVYLHLPVVRRLIFCILASPHLGTTFPLFHGYRTILVEDASRGIDQGRVAAAVQEVRENHGLVVSSKEVV